MSALRYKVILTYSDGTMDVRPDNRENVSKKDAQSIASECLKPVPLILQGDLPLGLGNVKQAVRAEVVEVIMSLNPPKKD